MLTFNLKKEWFEKIKIGEKTHEYREMTDNWMRKLIPKNFMLSNYLNQNIPLTNKTQYCNLVLGYPPIVKNPEKAKDKVLKAKILKITANVEAQTTDFKYIKPDFDVWVFDIEFELCNP